MIHHRVALVGNPNAGKSTIFNALTGENQHVGNWPGKTVELKTGRLIKDGIQVDLVDLPGAYSLSAFSLEEVVTRDYILQRRPDLILAVVDAANLERNLYLTVQVLELGVPVVVVLNMADVAAARGLKIDRDRLSQALQAPVVETIASKAAGLDGVVRIMLDQLSKLDSLRDRSTQTVPMPLEEGSRVYA